MANNKINKLHERCLQIIYSNKYLNYEEYLEKNSSASLHHRTLCSLATEMFKVVKRISPEIMKEVFHFCSKNNINLGQASTFYSRRVTSVHYVENSLAFLDPKIWELVPIEIRSSNSLSEFRRKIRYWETIDCLCKLFKI